MPLITEALKAKRQALSTELHRSADYDATGIASPAQLALELIIEAIDALLAERREART